MKKKLLAVALVLLAAGLAWAQSNVRVFDGAGYSVLKDVQGRCLLAIADSALPSTIGCQTGALLYRTDTTTWYAASATNTWTASTFAGLTFTSTTLTAPTLTTPTVTSPVITGTAGSGFAIVKKCTLTETGVAGPYTCTIPVPAGAVIEDVQVIGRVLWNGTSASLNVGDTADENGFFDTVNLKATDLVIGEMLSIKHGDLWGGQEGAYLVAATGRRGPTSSNFSLSYVAGSNITFVVTAGAADGSTGRTDCVVIYSTGEVIAQTTS